MSDNVHDLGSKEAVEIERSLRLIIPEGATFEVRIPKTELHGTVSGYFTDIGKAAVQIAARWNKKAPGIYVTLNPVNPAIKPRSAERFTMKSQQSTTDSEIVRRCWLPLDFDPIRPTGVSSTDAEHDAALQRAQDVRSWLSSQGWPEPLYADSGNGAHLLYRIDLPNESKSRDIVSGTLRAIAAVWSDDIVHVDTSVSNAARIWKIYGTLSAKGDNVSERPHRVSHILNVPGDGVLAAVPVETLAMFAKSVEGSRSDAQTANGHVITDLGKYAEGLGLTVIAGPMPLFGNGSKWLLESCPFNTDHKKPMIGLTEGRPIFRCLHQSCSTHGWRQFREKVDPTYQSPDILVGAILADPDGIAAGKYTEALARLSIKDYQLVRTRLRAHNIPGLKQLDKMVGAERTRIINAQAEGAGAPGNVFGLTLMLKEKIADGALPPVWYNVLENSECVGPVAARADKYQQTHAICIMSEFHREGLIWVSEAMAHRAAVMVMQDNQRNPLREYMEGLVWDATPRLNTWLHDILGAPDREYERAVGRKWMISAAARALQPGCQADHMLILEGKQAIGKSRALRVLGGEYYAEFSGTLRSGRDYANMVAVLNGKLILEMSELSAIKKAEIETLKAAITTPEDTVRLAYRRNAETYKRSCVMAGTTNELDTAYIKDTTGARRFWPVRCGSVNIALLQQVKDQLWAEAVYAFQNGEDWWTVPVDETLEEQAERSSQVEDDPWYDEIVRHIMEAQAMADGFVARYNANEHAPNAVNNVNDTAILFIQPGDILSLWLNKPTRDQTSWDVTRVRQLLVRMGFRSFKVLRDGVRKKRPILQPDLADPDLSYWLRRVTGREEG